MLLPAAKKAFSYKCFRIRYVNLQDNYNIYYIFFFLSGGYSAEYTKILGQQADFRLMWSLKELKWIELTNFINTILSSASVVENTGLCPKFCLGPEVLTFKIN